MIAGDLSLKRRLSLSRWQWLRAIFIVALFAAALALVFAFQSAPEPIRLEPGQVSSKTILA
ncbi:MAG TPA: hypothetical protein VF429_08660, partial [Anaerolineae bacterium]